MRDGVGITETRNVDLDEALALLNGGTKGVAEWNRRRFGGVAIPDLRYDDLSPDEFLETVVNNGDQSVHDGGVNLRDAALCGANLSRANLWGGVLSGADLSRADLGRANLRYADFNRANLSRANLRYADLRDVNLSGADLQGADLERAVVSFGDLSAANLSDASLRYAELRAVKLRDAIVMRADLSAADLGSANLSGANFSRADLAAADLSGANLSGANLTNAHCGSTIFANVDLSETEGLSAVKHTTPSTVAIGTVFLSKGKIPDAFLRGCGVPEVLIEYLPSLIASMSPIQFYSCFISYSHKDEAFAERLHNGLQAKGVRCWYAPHDLSIGARLRPAIDSSIQVYDKLLLVLSKNSVNSQWVEQEVETALRREREENATVLFPVRLDDAAFSIKAGWPALITNTRHIGDFRKWKEYDMFEATFSRLIRDLKAAVGTDPGALAAPDDSP